MNRPPYLFNIFLRKRTESLISSDHLNTGIDMINSRVCKKKVTEYLCSAQENNKTNPRNNNKT